MNPKQVDQFREYGDKELFEKMLKRGYKEVAIGTGAWREKEITIGIGTWGKNGGSKKHEEKIDLLAFFHPNWNWFSRVRAYEYYYLKFEDGSEKVTGPYEEPYGKREFNNHINQHEITLAEKQDLAELVKELEEQTEAVNL